MPPPKQANAGAEAKITPEDQVRINQFARMHNRIEDIRSECTSKQTQVQNMSDAADEILLLDDTSLIPMRIGDSFIHMSADEANAKMDEMKETLTKEIAKLKEEECTLSESLSKLKAELYAKFGDSINLDID